MERAEVQSLEDIVRRLRVGHVIMSILSPSKGGDGKLRCAEVPGHLRLAFPRVKNELACHEASTM